MIKAEQKPLDEILKSLAPYNRVLLAGCGACVTVCQAGGEKEVAFLASALRLARQKMGKPVEILEVTPPRQCEPEFALEQADRGRAVEAVLSLSCGVGVQTLVRFFPEGARPPGGEYGLPGRDRGARRPGRNGARPAGTASSKRRAASARSPAARSSS